MSELLFNHKCEGGPISFVIHSDKVAHSTIYDVMYINYHNYLYTISYTTSKYIVGYVYRKNKKYYNYCNFAVNATVSNSIAENNGMICLYMY